MCQEQLERPIERDPKAPITTWQAEQVVGPPEEPGDETRDLDAAHLADPLEAAK